MLKISLLFKKFTDFTGIYYGYTSILRHLNVLSKNVSSPHWPIEGKSCGNLNIKSSPKLDDL